MLFDCQLQVAQLEIAAAEDQSHVQLAILLALGLPAGPGQVVPLPAGILRFGLGKEASIEHGNTLVQAGESLPDPKPESDIIVAQSLANIDEAVEQVEQFRGGKKRKK